MRRPRLSPVLMSIVAACLALPSAAATYRKKPYLVPTGQGGQMYLVFQTSAAPASVQVGYGATPDATDFTAPAPQQTNSDYVYRASLTGLTAGQRVYYK